MRKAIFKAVIVILQAWIVNPCYAQNIKLTGSIKGEITKQILPNATISIKSIGTNLFKTTLVAGEDGTFIINLPWEGLYRVEASYLGYSNNIKDSILVDSQHASMNVIYMSLASKDLKTVSVSTTKKPFISIEANKIILNVSESAVFASGNAYEVLLNAPGVTEQNDLLSFRGKSLNVLINGRPSNLTGQDLKTMLTNMQASGIQKLEILPNPSAKYDANGGSVVNIILAKNKLFGTNYVFTNGIGSGQNLRGTIGLDINHREKNINLFGSYNFAHNQQYFKSYSTRFLNNSIIKTDEYEVRKRSNHAYKLGVDCDLNSHSSFGTLITGSLNYRDREVSNSSELNYAGQISDSSAKVSANGKSIINNPSVNLYYKNILDTTGTELTMNVDYMTYKKKWNDAFTNEYFDSHGIQYKKPNFLKDNSPAGISVYSFSADLVKPTKNARWETGLKTNYTVTDNDIFWQYKYDSGWVTDTGKTNHFVCRENINSAYLNYIQLIKKWNLQAGLRIEQTNTEGKSITLNQINRNSYLDFFPNISVGYTKDYNSVISFSYRKSINRFGFNIVNPFIIYQNQYAYSQGNPNIKPEIYQSAELSYTYKQAYSFSIDYTHGIKTLGEIFLPGANNVTISSYANYNSSDILYFSLSANRNVTEYWRVSFNPMYGYISLKNGVENFSTGSAKNLWVGELEWSNSFTLKKGWSGEFSLMYIRPFQYGSYTTHTIFSTDLGISKSAMKNKINIKLGISDFFNTLNYNKELNYAGIVTSLKYKPETRFINLLIKYKFGNGNVKVKYQKQSKISDLKNRIN